MRSPATAFRMAACSCACRATCWPVRRRRSACGSRRRTAGHSWSSRRSSVRPVPRNERIEEPIMSIRWHWGVGVTVVYTLFATSTVGFVAFAMSRPVSLVSDDYYEQSLQVDRQREAAANARALGDRVAIDTGTGEVLIAHLPVEQATALTGTITPYRSSDASADRVFTLAPAADGTQRVPLVGLQKGQWLAKLHWTVGGREFYVEQPVELR